MLTGLIKATHPKKFIIHLNKLGISSPNSGPLIALILTELECAVGFALLTELLLIDLIPPLLIFLFLASFISWWGIYNGKTHDCGCYGGVLWISPKTSWFINFLCAVILFLHWRELDDLRIVAQWKIWSCTGVLVVVNIIFKSSIKNAFVNFSPIKKGNIWKSKWLVSNKGIEEFEKILVVFLNQRCSQCQAWISHLNQFEKLEVQAIIPESDSVTSHSPSVESLHFPVSKIKAWKFNHLVDYPPQGVLLEKGKIIKIWNGDFPEELAKLTSSPRY